MAAGIQTMSPLEWLQHLGCKLDQGSLFTAPVPASSAVHYLSQPVVRLES